jgi:hypothetical protein
MNRERPIRVLLSSTPALLIDIASEITWSEHGMVTAI